MSCSDSFLVLLIFVLILNQFHFYIYNSFIEQFRLYYRILIVIFEFFFRILNFIHQIINNLKFPFIKNSATSSPLLLLTVWLCFLFWFVHSSQVGRIYHFVLYLSKICNSFKIFWNSGSTFIVLFFFIAN